MKIKTTTENLPSYQTYRQVEDTVNTYLQTQGYLKVDLPVLSPALIPESYLEVFQTEFKYFKKKQKLYLTPSPELFLKRLLVAGVKRCYYLGKSFRNSEPSSPLHKMEFTMLELYKVGAYYLDIATEVLTMLQQISLKIFGAEVFNYLGKKVDLKRWERFTVAEAFERFAKIKQSDLFDREIFLKRALQKKYRVDGFSYEDVFSQIYVQEIEPNLGTRGFPSLIYNFPKEFAALAKLNSDSKTAQRFEFYIAGIELGDCYTELNDWKEQENRFQVETNKRKKAEKIPYPIDKGFIKALKYGLPKCAGIAIGFDRLAMIFANQNSINKLKLITIE